MEGPYPSVERYCASLPRRDRERGLRIDSCAPAPNWWDDGQRRGARGPFLGGRLLGLLGHHGPHVVQLCGAALRTRAGWFVSQPHQPCEGPTPFGTVKTTPNEVRWADELGMGILWVHARHGIESNEISWRWWGNFAWQGGLEYASLTLCGIGGNGKPQCTAPLIANCAGGVLESSAGLLQNPELTDEPSGSFPCTRARLPSGEYRAPFEDAADSLARRIWRETTDDSVYEASEHGKLAGLPGYGPFPSVESYCTDVPSFSAQADWDVDVDLRERCVSSPRFRGALGPRGPLLGLRLLSVEQNTDLDVPARYCRVALRTARGWFVPTDYSRCEYNGSDAIARVQSRAPQWFVMDKQPVALIDAAWTQYPVEWYLGEEEFPDLDESAESPPSEPSQQLPEQGIGSLESAPRVVRACSVGASGIPSCTPWIEAGCANGNGQTSHRVTITDRGLEITPKKLPADTDLCGPELPHDGKFDLFFP